MISRKISALILTAMVLVSFLSSCGGNTASQPAVTTVNNETSADETAEETTSKLTANLPDVNYDGYQFVFMNGNVAEWMTLFVVTAAEETGDTINDAIYRRNLNVEEKFGVKISEISSSSGKSQTQKAIMAGDSSFDISLLVMADSFALALEALTIEYSNIPVIDVSKPWWIQNSITNLSIENKVFFGISQFDTTHYDGVRTLFFNKSMIENFKLDDPYELVNTGKWTIDEFEKMCTSVAADLNGNGEWDVGDRYGYTSYDGMCGQTFLTGIDAKASLKKDSNDLPLFDLDNEEYYTKFTRMAQVLNDTPGGKNPKGVSDTHGDVEAFINGYALFYIECLANAKHLRTMDTDFGILPSPKYNESQPEYHSLAGNPYFMIVPVTNSDLNRTGVIMEALAYESVDTVSTAFYDVLLMGKITRDNSSEEMLNLIFNSLSFYHPLCLSSLHTQVTTMVDQNKTDLASFFAKNKDKIQKEIDSAIEKYRENIE